MIDLGNILDIDIAFDTDLKLHSLIKGNKGYIIANDGAIVNEFNFEGYESICAAQYLEAFKVMHMYENQMGKTIKSILNNV